MLAGALAAYAMVEIWRPDALGVEAGGDKAVLVTTMLAATLPLALRRRAPLLVLVVVVAALSAQALLTMFLEGLAAIAALLVAVYSVAVHAGLPRAVAGLLAALACGAVIAESASDAAFNAFLVAGTWLGGRALRTARVRTRELEALAAQLEHEREERARLAVAEERARIARELHDVVAHGVSTMVVQAEAGEALLERGPERGASRCGRSRRRVARPSSRCAACSACSAAARRSSPSRRSPAWAELGRLADQITNAGLPVELEIVGEPRAVRARARPVRVPDRAGGADERAHVRRPRAARVTVRYGAEARARDRRTTVGATPAAPAATA